MEKQYEKSPSFYLLVLDKEASKKQLDEFMRIENFDKIKIFTSKPEKASLNLLLFLFFRKPTS